MVKAKKTDALKDQLARALADYDNLRKRTETEKSLWLIFAKQELLLKLLPVLDTLEIAQKHLKDEGLQMAIGQFQNIFQEEGIVEIESGKFDAKIHEAVETLTGGEKEKVAEVISKGYKFKDGPVIRPAKVKVYK